ncbi:hypothetical protein V8E55_005995 [Tylopilus felleus]
MTNSKQYRGNQWDLVKDESNPSAFTCQDCPPDRGPCFDMGDNMLLSGVAKMFHLGGSIKLNPVPCLVCHHHGGRHRQGYVWEKQSQAPSPPNYHWQGGNAQWGPPQGQWGPPQGQWGPPQGQWGPPQ